MVVFLRSATKGLCPITTDNCDGMPALCALLPFPCLCIFASLPTSSSSSTSTVSLSLSLSEPLGELLKPNPAFSKVSQANFSQSPQKPYACLTPQSMPGFHCHSPSLLSSFLYFSPSFLPQSPPSFMLTTFRG